MRYSQIENVKSARCQNREGSSMKEHSQDERETFVANSLLSGVSSDDPAAMSTGCLPAGDPSNSGSMNAVSDPSAFVSESIAAKTDHVIPAESETVPVTTVITTRLPAQSLPARRHHLKQLLLRLLRHLQIRWKRPIRQPTPHQNRPFLPSPTYLCNKSSR